MTERWEVPKFNPGLSGAEREAVMAHVSKALAADFRDLDPAGQIEVLVSTATILFVQCAWAVDRAAELERRVSELESKQSPRGSRA